MTDFEDIENGADAGAPGNPLPADDWGFLHVVHAVVEAPSSSDAIDRGATALAALTARSDVVDGYQLVADFDRSPERYLTRRWDTLPGTTRIDTPTGRRVLRIALERRERDTERADDDRGPRPDPDSAPNPLPDEKPPYLWTDAGFELETRMEVLQHRRSSDNPLWLVPAVAFRYLGGGSHGAED